MSRLYIYTYQLAAVFLDLKHVVKNLRCEEVKLTQVTGLLRLMVQQKKYSTRDLVILDILGILQPAMFFFYRKVSEEAHGLTDPVIFPSSSHKNFDPSWGSPNKERRHGFGVMHHRPKRNSAKTWIWFFPTNQVGFILFFVFSPQRKHEKSESGGDSLW